MGKYFENIANIDFSTIRLHKGDAVESISKLFNPEIGFMHFQCHSVCSPG